MSDPAPSAEFTPTLAGLAEPLPLARTLIRRPSVTPKDEGALGVLVDALTGLGFQCHRMSFGAGDETVDNLYARLGTASPNFCFAGHTDVVPVGTGWTTPPFDALIQDGKLFGRGASDMKAAIAAFVAAVARHLAAGGKPRGSISLLITGDEEGDAVNGTKKVLNWLADRNEKLDVCVVGEPTSATRLGDTVKIGRRGSLTAKLTVFGTQGHSAYPHLADNPIPKLMKMLAAIMEPALDQGSAHFQPSTVAITTIDVGNAASNVIPAQAKAGFNIRFNDHHDSTKLKAWLKSTFDRLAGDGGYDLAVKVSGESFLTPPGALSDIVAGAIKETTGRAPELSTSGGTSDARFIKDACAVCEFGMVGLSMHKSDEHCTLADLEQLTVIYHRVLDRYFGAR